MARQTSPTARGEQAAAAPALFLALFAVQSTVFVLPPLAAAVAEDLGSTVAAVAELRAASGLVAGLTTLVVAARSGHHVWSLRGILVTGLLVSAAGSLVAGLAPTFAVLALVHVALGLGLGLTVAAALAATATWAPPEGRRALLSRAMMGPPTAAIVTTTLAGVLAGLYWRAAWLAVPATASVIAVVLVLQRPAEESLEPAARSGRVWTLPAIRGWLLGELLAYSAWSVVVVFSAPLLIQSYGVSPARAAVVVAASAAVFMVGNRLTRHWLDHARVLLLVLALLLAVAAGVLGWHRPDFGLSAALLVLLGALQGGRSLAGSAFGLTAAPKYRLDTMALRSTAQQFGYLIGAGLGGIALSTVGYTGLGTLMAVLFVLAAVPHARALLHRRDGRATTPPAQSPTGSSPASAQVQG